MNQYGCKSKKHTPDPALTSTETVAKIEKILLLKQSEESAKPDGDSKTTSLASLIDAFVAQQHKLNK